jgi:hypothetical protein
LNEPVAVDIAPKEQIVAIEVLDGSELVTDFRAVSENLAVAPRHG